MNQLGITVTDLREYHIPETGRHDLEDIRYGYIISPPNPGRHKRRPEGSIELTISSKAVSLLH